MIIYNNGHITVEGMGGEIVPEYIMGTMLVLGNDDIRYAVTNLIEMHENEEGHSNPFLKDFAEIIKKHEDYIKEFAEQHRVESKVEFEGVEEE